MQTKHPWLTEIGKNVRKFREARGISQEQLAAFSGMDRTYIGGIERGERNVAAINLIRIALALNIEVAALFPSVATLRQVNESVSVSDKESVHGE